MIVHRVTVQCQLNMAAEAMTLLQEEITRAGFPHGVRLYRPRGISDVTVSEFEFKNHDEMDRFWADWEARPETQAFWQKYQLLIQAGMVHEIFDLVS